MITKNEYTYVNKKSYLNWTNKSRQLGICKVEKGAANGSCKTTVTQAVKSEVSTEFGLSTTEVSANAGMNLAYSQTVSVSWASARARVGRTFKAWAVGKRTTFNTQK
ncbi:hypothetical protein EDF62_0914 [Leucobacter luti]|uniref:Uncharacterized protein n=1 Tax=Leucobacter luti TaxID=340320 RepID=A0A4R6S6R9_9MICO|nr:hypothetical protein [Leucobacter luti]TDP94496.1 hypothetical protein EDF62_0914 [Leucobacter luti]